MSNNIIVPVGQPIKRITVDLDNAGNITMRAVDLLASDFNPATGVRVMRPLSTIETLYWLSKIVTDVLAKLQAAPRPVVAAAGGFEDDNKEQKTD